MSADQENPGDVLASIAQQVAQASKTTTLHIKEHDDIEQAAQEKADLVIVKIMEELERAHRLAVEHATEALKSSHNHELHRNLTNIAKRFNETLDELVSQHRSTLEEHIETLGKADRERAEIYNREAEQVRGRGPEGNGRGTDPKTANGEFPQGSPDGGVRHPPERKGGIERSFPAGLLRHHYKGGRDAGNGSGRNREGQRCQVY